MTKFGLLLFTGVTPFNPITYTGMSHSMVLLRKGNLEYVCTVQCRDKHPKICMQNACAQFAYTRVRLSVHAFPTHLISMYELAYCLLCVRILLLALAAVHCKSMAR